MAKIIELNNDLLLSKVGGLALTVTDTDTGAINPVDLRCDRAGERTGTNKDGEIYTARSYEPAFELKDGEMTVSNEPSSYNSFLNSLLDGGGATPTNWTAGASAGTSAPVQSVKYSEATAYTYTTQMAGSQVIYQFLSPVDGGTYTLSAYVENANSPQAVSDFIFSTQAISDIVYKKNGTPINSSENIETGFFYEMTFKAVSAGGISMQVGARGNNRSLTFSLPQIEPGSSRTSFIPSSIGATGIRLADTGFVTPDLSKYINSEDINIELDIKALTEGGSTRNFSLSSSTSNSITIQLGATALKYILVANSVEVFRIEHAITQTDRNNINLKAASGNSILIVNGSEVGSDNSSFTFSEDLGVINFGSSDLVSAPFYANTFGFKIE